MEITECRDPAPIQPTPSLKEVRKDHNAGGKSRWMEGFWELAAPELWRAIGDSNATELRDGKPPTVRGARVLELRGMVRVGRMDRQLAAGSWRAEEKWLCEQLERECAAGSPLGRHDGEGTEGWPVGEWFSPPMPVRLARAMRWRSRGRRCSNRDGESVGE